jgi:hypothetical protein
MQGGRSVVGAVLKNTIKKSDSNDVFFLLR